MNLVNKIKNLATDATCSSSAKETWFITAESGEELKFDHKFFKSDPYLKIQFGGKTFKTRTVKNSRSPQWKETFECQLNHHDISDINIKLLDEDIGSDDTIGQATVQKSELPSNSGEERLLRIPLLHKQEVYGTVILRVRKSDDGSSQQHQQYQQNDQYQQQQKYDQYQQHQQNDQYQQHEQHHEHREHHEHEQHQQYQQQPQFQSQPQNFQQQSNYNPNPNLGSNSNYYGKQ